MADFCKQFNEKTNTLGYERDLPLAVRLTALSDRSFTFVVKSPPTAFLIKRVIGMKKGPTNPDAAVASGFITPEAVLEIARIKKEDANRWHLPLEGIARSVVGTCRSMGVQVREEEAHA
jgi:large subunit ribosomal protein L11